MKNLYKLIVLFMLTFVTLHASSDYTKGFINYKKGFKNLESNPSKAQKYFEKAIPFLENAAKHNSGPAYFMLGRMYCNGWGVEIDYKKAEDYFLKAIKLGDIRSNCCIARLYLIKMKQHIKSGLEHFKIANSNNLKACKNIQKYIEKNNLK